MGSNNTSPYNSGKKITMANNLEDWINNQGYGSSGSSTGGSK